jgi:hypothetical protein
MLAQRDKAAESLKMAFRSGWRPPAKPRTQWRLLTAYPTALGGCGNRARSRAWGWEVFQKWHARGGKLVRSADFGIVAAFALAALAAGEMILVLPLLVMGLAPALLCISTATEFDRKRKIIFAAAATIIFLAEGGFLAWRAISAPAVHQSTPAEITTAVAERIAEPPRVQITQLTPTLIPTLDDVRMNIEYKNKGQRTVRGVTQFGFIAFASGAISPQPENKIFKMIEKLKPADKFYDILLEPDGMTMSS